MSVPAEYGIRARIASLVSGRVYPMVFPPGVTFPCITSATISRVVHQTHANANPLQEPRIQLTYWAKKYDDVKVLAVAVFALLNGFKGSVTTPNGPVVFSSILFAEDHDDYDPETQLFKLTADYKFWHAPS